MRIVFFGSPGFAVPSLEALLAAGHEVTLALSQPPKPVGRKGLLTDPPAAMRAREAGVPLFQPSTLRDDAVQMRLAKERADIFVVVAYGKLLPEALLELPRLGCLNVHGSLLPRWRGASPIQAALLAGDLETGVSLMRMEAGMDTGPVFASVRTLIRAGEDAGSLSARIAQLGAELLVETLPAVEAGRVRPVPQDGAVVTTCPKIRREDGRVDWGVSAEELARRGRAFTPWPGLFALRGGVRVKLLEVEPRVSGVCREPAPVSGTVLEVGEELVVACGRGALAIRRLQTEGRKPLPAADHCRGERVVPGELFS